MSMPPRTPTRRRGSAGEEMRLLIETAEQEGVDRKKMVLRMTLRDASELKRDPKVAMEDISYTDGRMRYLGVPVAQGGVVTSILDTSGGPIDIEPPAPPVKVKKPAKPRVTKASKAKAAAEAEAAEAAEAAAAE
jgi:hypothetical protein